MWSRGDLLASRCAVGLLMGNGVPECAAVPMSRPETHALNEHCDCWPMDSAEAHRALSHPVRASLGPAHKHLFANTGVFLHRDDLAAMHAQVSAIEAVAQLPGFVAATQGSASSTPAGQTATRGVLMAYDFHVTPTGPRLIEINTNAGGAFLVSQLVDQLQSDQPELPTLASPGIYGEFAGDRLVEMFAAEWRLAGRAGVPHTIAIVDDDPQSQYLYSDMLAAAEVLRQRFAEVVVLAAKELRFTGTSLTAEGLSGRSIDLVYNRHTDFTLAGSDVGQLNAAWLADRVVLTPSPRHHRVFANKQNLPLLGNLQLLQRFGAGSEHLRALQALLPCVKVTKATADALWARRRELFFKPAAGFGGRAAYRGAKLTKRVWAQIVSGDYIAQEFVPPTVRRLPGASAVALKYDLRLYTYAGNTLGVVARLYSGQTTNFRTPGGGFAPVALLSA